MVKASEQQGAPLEALFADKVRSKTGEQRPQNHCKIFWGLHFTEGPDALRSLIFERNHWSPTNTRDEEETNNRYFAKIWETGDTKLVSLYANCITYVGRINNFCLATTEFSVFISFRWNILQSFAY